ncbi:hypothetical protein A2630_00725 [Candidatus Woesebacteria bacterium RIFCSPHIGHO2_01_FULL_44_10]|uniref:inosine/xanthosine triphosphatase n=1 Tax=Candidatus Woesebacteria bacterium RIFCSPLOWO2_01_FULL_44_14 TaxID=1802525 RepID=A0A1F8C3K9_9BACT|nr:MAG: hypothetical protein A2630_00725 [Candidatus Woesebacteria bacterium RIFCSPHIGHO2_01_FULL_44_10]OGM54354.1 MAG: hypothetical protein A3F62_01205 [Candidatus Woesebacteria bacterium RIFCSPHIGHO2_12_FULL_44_11]OGM70255.1 MAG: hypothetical protein A2975_04250 [Candidatus Woesebacteria bacterium RIFCSPLOWO2_01_FULL_44_14]
MKVIIGSNNKDKIKIAKDALGELHLDVEVEGKKADSGIADQPLDKETTQAGAINRARNTKMQNPEADFSLGLEGGLHDYGEGYHLVTFACLVDKTGNKFVGEGEEIHLPIEVSEKVKNGEWFGKVIREYAKKNKIDNNLITRLSPFAQAIQNAYAEYLKSYGDLGHRDKASGVITNSDGKLLIVQLTTYGEGQWNFPGGGIEDNESEDQTILRELKEELGTDKFEIVRKSRYIEKYEWPPFVIAKRLKAEKRTWRGQRVRYFLIKFLGNDKDLKPDSGEIEKIKWIKKEELKGHFIFPKQLELAEKVIEEFLI